MTQEAQFIDKQSLIKAIEDATVDVYVVADYSASNYEHTVKEVKSMQLIDAHKLLEVLKNV